MKLKLVLLSSMLFASTVHAELPECQRVGYTHCSVDQPCPAMVYAHGGMCIKLGQITKGTQYHCEKSGIVTIDKFDYTSANAEGIAINQLDLLKFEIDARHSDKSFGEISFGVYNAYDRPEHFTISCNVIK